MYPSTLLGKDVPTPWPEIVLVAVLISSISFRMIRRLGPVLCHERLAVDILQQEEKIIMSDTTTAW